MQVILLERVEKLGTIGDEVERNGFARNFLIPQGKAHRSNDEPSRRKERAEIEARNEQAKQKQQLQVNLERPHIHYDPSGSENGQLFGSVTARDISESAAEAGQKVEKRQVLLDGPIKTIGLRKRQSAHPEVTVSVTVNIARSEDEAERQAAGENVVETRSLNNALIGKLGHSKWLRLQRKLLLSAVLQKTSKSFSKF